MKQRSAVHNTFVIDRHFAADPARVYQAFADPAAKALWFGGPNSSTDHRGFDFREGGRETVASLMDDGTKYRYQATYTDIVPGVRIVYTYEMSMGDDRISVSVVTVEVAAGRAGGADLKITEQGVYLDGLDAAESRRQGTEDLMNALEKSLATDVG